MLLLIFLSFFCSFFGVNHSQKLLLVTIATEETDGYLQFKRSADYFGYSVETFGMGETWKGGDVAVTTGGGHKINILKKELRKYKDRDDLLIMFSDSYDVVITAPPEKLIANFWRFKPARIVFTAEGFCWPDESLMVSYPPVGLNEKRYLNSGGYIGYAKDIYEIISLGEISDDADDQLYFTKIFLNESYRRKYGIRLDSRSSIFQALNGALDDVQLVLGKTSHLKNIRTNELPVVVHGNGPIKDKFNAFANYLANAWTVENGCKYCKEDLLPLSDEKREDWPRVVIAIFVDQPTPFITEFFETFLNLDYPKHLLHLFIYVQDSFHFFDAVEFVMAGKDKFASITKVLHDAHLLPEQARDEALIYSRTLDVGYFFYVDSTARMDTPSVLRKLIEQNRPMLCPLMRRPSQLWSTFWGATNDDGYYAKGLDYDALVLRERTGVWNVPLINYIYLIRMDMLSYIMDRGVAYNAFPNVDFDLSFAWQIRKTGKFMYMTNLEEFGHLVNPDGFNISYYRPDFVELVNNRQDWEARYIHKDYKEYLNAKEFLQPCRDVFWLPVASPKMCRDIIDTMENFGDWSTGNNEDDRLDGGYENVPTRDIHLNQVYLDDMWLQFMADYISPVQQRVFAGYSNFPPDSYMMFVVRYRPDEQPYLRPHNDASTYTINIALNEVNKDFMGGGCRFLRYNCSVTSPRLGWMFIHPGRLTHHHEGLYTVAGTRYIMVNFIDP